MSNPTTTALVLMDDHIRWVMVPQARFQAAGIYYQMLHDISTMCAQIPVVKKIVEIATELPELLKTQGAQS